MARFIDKPPGERGSSRSTRSLATRDDLKNGQVAERKLTNTAPFAAEKGRIPNASIVYGIAAAVLLVIGLYNMFALANWMVGLLILILAGTLAGYAWYFMRYR